MRCAVTFIARNRRGQAQKQTRLVEGEQIRLGRGTQCEIHLPDPRVALHHASIYSLEGGIFVQADPATITVNGLLERLVKLAPGIKIALGPYDIFVLEKTAEAELALSIELARPLPDGLTTLKQKSRLSLAATGLSKRGLTLWLAGFILLVFIIFPVVNALITPLRKLSADWPLTPDQSWNPGTLLRAHQSFGKACGTCHVIPFQQVQNKVCQECHKTIGEHVDIKLLSADLFPDARCASCHRDHKGEYGGEYGGGRGLARQDEHFCIDCHTDIKRVMPTSQTGDVTDFVQRHPEFKLSLPGSNGRYIRVRQSDKPKESSNLHFPHSAHLVKKGVRSPNGRVVLECSNCHQLDAGNKLFKPINMKEMCLECHSLQFEPAVTARQVPHGSVDEVMLTLKEFYASIALQDIPVDVIAPPDLLRRKPGKQLSEEERQVAFAWANRKAQKIAEDLFEVRVCNVCHEVTKIMDQTGDSFNITPVRISQHWFSKARFDHGKHRSFACIDCHAVEKSKQSADIAIPDITVCRNCHSGAEAQTGKIISTCLTCHGFHYANHAPFGTTQNKTQNKTEAPR